MHTRSEGRERGRGGHRQFCLPKFAHVEVSLSPERFTESNHWMLPISSLRIGREQHVPYSSNHSPHHLTFRALHGNHIVSTPFQTVVEEDTQKTITHVSVHILTFHETHYPLSPPGNPNHNSVLIPREGDQRRITETIEKLAKSLPGPLVKLSN